MVQLAFKKHPTFEQCKNITDCEFSRVKVLRKGKGQVPSLTHKKIAVCMLYLSLPFFFFLQTYKYRKVSSSIKAINQMKPDYSYYWRKTSVLNSPDCHHHLMSIPEKHLIYKLSLPVQVTPCWNKILCDFWWAVGEIFPIIKLNCLKNFVCKNALFISFWYWLLYNYPLIKTIQVSKLTIPNA